MKKTANRIMAILLCLCALTVHAYGVQYLIPVGQVFGLQLSDNSVVVAAFDDIIGGKAREAGLCVGDYIIDINGNSISCAEDVRKALDSSHGNVKMLVERQGRAYQLALTPEITDNGPKLGVYLKQGITGIGTVTWYDPETGTFGALGHGVNNASGKLVNMVSGSAYQASVVAVKRGKAGAPGQLRGNVNATKCIGNLTKNTGQGIFGSTEQGWQGESMEVASWEDIHTGHAVIRSTVSGNTVHEYSVEILKIYPNTKSAGRNFLIRIDDQSLLDATGGIVQGMSGSPIIQDGKLVGAVTHVLVNDPTTGYGIFIENMLSAAA